MKYLHLIATSLLCISLNSHAAQQFYKWVDDNGVTHYSATPPENASKASKVKVGSGPTPADTSATATTPAAPATAPSAKPDSKAPSGISQKAADALAKNATKNAEECANLKQSYQTLLDHGRVRQKNEDGSTRVMSDEEKMAAIKNAEQQINDYCK